MVIHAMTLILAVGRNMEWTMTLNICMIRWKKILDINYTHGSLKQPTTKNILWRVTILFICQIMGERGGLFRAKVRLPEGKKILQSKRGIIFWRVI